MNRATLISVILLSMLALGACTAEEDIPYKCDLASTEPNHGCVAGYECVAMPDGEVCRLKKTSKSSPLTRAPAAPALRSADPNLRFLERLGYVSSGSL